MLINYLCIHEFSIYIYFLLKNANSEDKIVRNACMVHLFLLLHVNMIKIHLTKPIFRWIHEI